MGDIPENVVNLATVLAKVFEERKDEKRSYLKNPDYWIGESKATKNPIYAEQYLAAELARIHFRAAVEAAPKAWSDYWLDSGNVKKELEPPKNILEPELTPHMN